MFLEHVPDGDATLNNSETEHNAAGIPIFAKVDLEQLAPAVVLELLKKFVSSLWCKLYLSNRVRV